MQAVLVIDTDLLAVDNSSQRGKSLGCTEAAIRLALIDEFLRIFAVDSGAHALALHIGADSAVFLRAFILDQTGLFHSPLDDLDSALHIAALVCIFNAENEIAVFMFGDQIGIERRTQISYMHASRGTRGISCSDFHDVSSRNMIRLTGIMQVIP